MGPDKEKSIILHSVSRLMSADQQLGGGLFWQNRRRQKRKKRTWRSGQKETLTWSACPLKSSESLECDMWQIDYITLRKTKWTLYNPSHCSAFCSIFFFFYNTAGLSTLSLTFLYLSVQGFSSFNGGHLLIHSGASFKDKVAACCVLVYKLNIILLLFLAGNMSYNATTAFFFSRDDK